jgi:succinate dehydrogenase hydrophobic anchor subunit
MRLRDRPTPDLIVMALTGLVVVLLVGSMLAVLILELTGSSEDIPALAGKLADVTNTLIGAVVGYIAGKGTNGHQDADADGPP